MHPILFEIPLSLTTAIIVALIFGVGAVIRHRFEPSDGDSSYLATFLGLNVKWGAVRNDWGSSLVQGLISGGIAGGVVFAARLLAPRFFPEYAPTDGGPYKLPLHIYGLMMATAFLVAIWLATREAEHERLPHVTYKDRNGKWITIRASDLVSDLAFYVFISGLAGSRILYIITRWDAEYSSEPLKMFNPFAGGLVWYGGLIAATATSAWFIRRHKVAFLPYADVLVPGVSIAHGIGRLGCFSAGCCFGNIASPGFPLAVQFPPGSPAAIEHWQAAGMYTLSRAVYPTQIMEALGELCIFLTLLFIRSRKRFHGQVVLTYFFLYAILRTIMEMFRGDTIRGFVFQWPAAGEHPMLPHPMLMSTSQAASIVTAIGGIIATIVISRSRSRRGADAMPTAKAA